MSRSNFQEIIKLANELESNLKKFQELYEQLSDDFMDEFQTPEEHYQRFIIFKVFRGLEYALPLIEDLYKPVVVEGFIRKNSKGQYEVEGFDLYPEGRIEFWYDDDYTPEWSHYIPSTIAISEEGDYYIDALGSDVKIEGIKVRIK